MLEEKEERGSIPLLINSYSFILGCQGLELIMDGLWYSEMVLQNVKRMQFLYGDDIYTKVLDNCFRGNLSFSSFVLVCKGIEGETSHSLLTWPTTKLSSDWGQPSRSYSGGSIIIASKNEILANIWMWWPRSTESHIHQNAFHIPRNFFGPFIENHCNWLLGPKTGLLSNRSKRCLTGAQSS